MRHGEEPARERSPRMTQAEYLVRVGIDWASESHQICILDKDGNRTEHPVPHTSAGLMALATELAALNPEDPGRVAVAIEVPRGPVVDTLLERGLHVFALNPKATGPLPRSPYRRGRQGRPPGCLPPR